MNRTVTMRSIALIMIMLLLAACGNVPTDGLTSFMSANQTESSGQIEAATYFQKSVAQCEGSMDSDNNTVRISFKLETGEMLFDTDEQFLFGGGARLLAEGLTNASGELRIRCAGTAEMTAMPLKANSQTVGWVAHLTIPQLTVELPSGEARDLENVGLQGLLAPSAGGMSIMFETLYGGGTDSSLQSFFTMQKRLFQNHPDPAFVQAQALNAGLSEENATRLAALYGENDVAMQRRLLVDMITSVTDEAYGAEVVETTVKTLSAMGLDAEKITMLFEEETNGRISVDLSKVGPGSMASAVIEVTNRDNAGNVDYSLVSDGSGSESGEGGSEGSDPNTDPETDPGTNPGTDPGSDPQPQPNPETDPETEPDGKLPGGRNAGEFFRDLFWNVTGGISAGAGFGAMAGGVGAWPGGAVGGLIGATVTVLGGVFDPDPNGSGGPCKSPIVYC